MVLRISGLFTVLSIAVALVLHQLGILDGVLLLRLCAAVSLSAGLLLVVRLPWDLTFQARNALARQLASQRRGLVVDEAEIAFARASAQRALLLAIGLHLSGAGLAFAGREILGPELGSLMALAFLGSMGLRPIQAFYLHTAQRLGAAADHAELPPPDARSLAASMRELEQALREQERALEAHREAIRDQLAVMDERTTNEASGWRRAATSTDEKLDRVLRELERTVERTQQNAEVLAGIRAFVRLVREG